MGSADANRRPSPTAESGSWGSRLVGWVGAVATTTTAVGFLTYIFLRFDYALFYGEFGLKPEDIGLGQAELIAQSLIGVLLMLVVLLTELAFITACVWIIQSLGRAVGRDILEIYRRHGLGGAIAVVGFFIVVFVARVVLGLPFLVSAAVAIGAAALALVAVQAADRRHSNEEVTPPEDAAQGRPRGPWVLRRMVLIVLLVVTLALGELILALSAIDDARRVQDGRVVRPTIFGIPFASWSALPARISWTSGNPPEGEIERHCLLYLGQASGAAVFYDHDRGETLRIPTGSLVIAFSASEPNAIVCPSAG